MEVGSQELSGYYTYRSFLDNPLPVNDFNEIKVSEAELFLIVQLDGLVTGTLSFPAESGASQKTFMDITGTVKSWLPESVFPIKDGLTYHEHIPPTWSPSSYECPIFK